MPGSMEARLADLVKARLFAFGAGTPIFAWRVLVQTPPGGSGARVNGSAFGKPCEGAVVCAWGGDPTFTETAVMGPTGIFASETTVMPPTGIFVVGNHSHGPHRRLRCPELHSWAPVGVFAVPNHTHGPRKASSLSETAVTGPYVSVVRFAEDDKVSESGHLVASPGTTCVARVP